MSAPTHEISDANLNKATNPDALEVAPGTVHEKLEGWVPELASEDEIRAAFEKAFDFRGDVTITRKDGTKVEGYIFDRRTGATLSDSVVRLFPKDSDTKISIPYSNIAALVFSGRDTAAGKSYEAWVKKYWEKRAAGEKNIGIAPEALE
ncbi:MAG: hypothetical protein JWO20_2173 [Candidatus Angelobacter sp.]|jgi:hypothetical protein|nr:hypothetical protein [Candidatus Angelobacter sp.]